MSRELTVYLPGRVEYDEAVSFQRALVEELHRTGEDRAALILLEHPPIITIGRSGTARNVLADEATLAREGVAVRETNRGGDVTYHGPGQVVGYPVIPLVFHGKDVHRYLRSLEAVLIATLADYGIAAIRRAGYTGVWTPSGKIVSIGVAISHWIAYHGFALNAAPNLDHFKLIHPCGYVGLAVTSMKDLLEEKPDRDELLDRIVEHFRAEFGFTQTTVLREPLRLEAAARSGGVPS